MSAEILGSRDMTAIFVNTFSPEKNKNEQR